jgi:plastocyanin domain-containing protein
MDKFIVTAGGLATIIGIYWFFFGRKEISMNPSNTWDILVAGGYKPNTIKIKKGEQATLTFTRTDNNSCLEEVVFPDYKIKEYLPLNKPVTITLPPSQKGTSNFQCSMQMFHGRIEIV